jgi:hypothetical protein
MGGIPVRMEERKGTTAPRKAARVGGRRNPPTKMGKCIGRKIFPAPKRWKIKGRASPRAPNRLALAISLTDHWKAFILNN